MKSSFNAFLAVPALTIAALIGVPAEAAIAISLSDNAGTTTCGPVAGNAIVCTSSDAAYTIQLATAIDNTPGGPAHQGKSLNISSTAAAVGNPLTLTVSSTGFLMPT